MVYKCFSTITAVFLFLVLGAAGCGRIQVTYVADATASPPKLNAPTPMQTAVLETPPTLAPTYTSEPSAVPTDTPTPAPTVTVTRRGQGELEVVQETAVSPTKPSQPAIVNTPEIAFFQIDPYQAMPGTDVTIQWAAYGQQATLCKRYPAKNEENCTPVDLIGSTANTIEEDTNEMYIDFILHVYGNGQENSAWNSVSVVCHPDQWFFADPPTNCPAAPPVFTNAAAQRFEYGLMIWLEDSNEIMVFFDDYERRFRIYPDTFLVEPPEDPDIAAPENFVAPVRGFGIIWRGEAPQSADVRRRLGWALAPEFNYQAEYQRENHPDYPRLYLQTPDDVRVLELNPGYWSIWNEWR